MQKEKDPAKRSIGVGAFLTSFFVLVVTPVPAEDVPPSAEGPQYGVTVDLSWPIVATNDFSGNTGLLWFATAMKNGLITIPMGFRGAVAEQFSISVSALAAFDPPPFDFYYGKLTVSVDWFPFTRSFRGPYAGLYVCFPYYWLSTHGTDPGFNSDSLLYLSMTPLPSAWLGIEVGFDLVFSEHFILDLAVGGGRPFFSSTLTNWIRDGFHGTISLGYYW